MRLFNKVGRIRKEVQMILKMMKNRRLDYKTWFLLFSILREVILETVISWQKCLDMMIEEETAQQ